METGSEAGLGCVARRDGPCPPETRSAGHPIWPGRRCRFGTDDHSSKVVRHAISADIHPLLADSLAGMWDTESDDMYSTAARVRGLLASLSRLAVVALIALFSTRRIRAQRPSAPKSEPAA